MASSSIQASPMSPNNKTPNKNFKLPKSMKKSTMSAVTDTHSNPNQLEEVKEEDLRVNSIATG